MTRRPFLRLIRARASRVYRCSGARAIVNRGRCLIRNHHDPQRHPLAGYRCRLCNCALSGLSDAGLLDGGDHVPLIRRVYARKNGEITRTSEW